MSKTIKQQTTSVLETSGLAAILSGVFLSACATGMPALSADSRAGVVPDGYALVWADEFDGDALDTTRWAYDDHANAGGWYNNELQYYSAVPDDAVRVGDGVLRITARRADVSDRADGGGQDYVSGRIFTRGLAAWRYAFVSVRAKVACGQGAWPAIWMMGDTPESGLGWPDGGEIDIMEYVGKQPGVIHSNVHTPASVAGRQASAQGSLRVPDACLSFHDYQVEYTPDAITFAVDGQVYNRYARDRSMRDRSMRDGNSDDAWPFDRAQYILLNLAVGGDWGGPVDDTIFPTTFTVDHVRVYQRATPHGADP